MHADEIPNTVNSLKIMHRYPELPVTISQTEKNLFVVKLARNWPASPSLVQIELNY